nr:MAG TPA: Protein prenyltransferase alpha subunit repeat [Caudoviricetes sp.]
MGSYLFDCNTNVIQQSGVYSQWNGRRFLIL